MNLDSAIKAAIDGRALLILGAGFSRNANNLRGHLMPSADELRKLIYSEVCNEEMDSIPKQDWEELEDLVERCMEEGRTDRLCGFLKTCFMQDPLTIASPSDEQTILELPWRRIYSTNYDDVAENYSRSARIPRIPVTPDKSIKEHRQDQVIVHLNGYIDDLVPAALNSSFKLSSSSYLENDFNSNEWVQLLKSDIDAATAVILIGISGKSDLDLKRLIYNDGQYKDKLIFIDVSIRIHDNRLKFGSIETIGTHGLAEEIEKIKGIHIKDSTAFLYSCFEQFQYSNMLTAPSIDSTARRMLLEKGIIDIDILKNHISDNEYLFSRSEIEPLLELVQSFTVRCVCITARLANGKTCFLDFLSAMLIRSGWDVFFYQHENVHLQEELDSFRSTQKPTAIIIESYHLYFSLLERMRRVMDNQKVVLILSSRTGIHTSVNRRLSDTIDVSEDLIQEVNLDYLAPQDINTFVDILDKGDYLLDQRNLSHQQKCALVSRTCNSSISAALLKYVHSQTVKDRLEKSIQSISNDLTAQKIVISTFVLQMLSIDLNANELYSLLDIRGLSQATLNNPGFQDLIEIKSGKITSHSTVLAQYIISQQQPKVILQSMEAMNQNTERIFSADKQYAIRASFITYSNLNLLISHNARSKSTKCQILEYYYSLSQSRIYDDNPFFWLQYAIASMELPDYSRAESLLQKAYDCASKRPMFDTFQIDTQYARFILARSCDMGSATPYDDFMDASNYWDKAVRSPKSNPRLVIRQVVKAYPKFFLKYQNFLSKGEKNKLLDDTQKFIDLAQKNNAFSRQHSRPSEIISEADLNVLRTLKKDILKSECVVE